MDRCRAGHELTPKNSIYRERNGRTVRDCQICKNQANAARERTEPPVTPGIAANSLTSRGETTGRPVLIGSFPDAETWKQAHGATEAIFTTSPRTLHDMDPTGLRIILLPSYTQLPQFWFLQVEVRLLERRGAVVEKA